MKVVLSVSENWSRLYVVEIPDDTIRSSWDSEAIQAYDDWLNAGAPESDLVSQLSPPEFIDDGPRDTFFVTHRQYEE
jgi:hypothetical protein